MNSTAQSGQSLVETVAAIPILMLCALIGMQGLAFGAAWLQADNAAHAASLAALSNEPAAPAAQNSLPGWARGRVTLRQRAGRVDVWLAPRAFLPPLARVLRAHGSATYLEPANSRSLR